MKFPLLFLLAALGAGSAFAQSRPAPEATPAPSPAKKLRGFMKKYDANGNGVLDPEEKAAMQRDRAAKRAERLKKYDADGDGKLSPEERSKMKADRAAEKRAKKAEAAPNASR